MLIACISGSPRENGNSVKIINKVASYFQEKGARTEIIKLSEINIAPCIHCDFCKTNDYCNQDEKANEVNGILEQADAIIVATPVYFGGITGQLKCLLDKTLPVRRNGFRLKGKVGAAIATGGTRNGGQELAIKDIHAWMLIQGMVIVGDNSHFGGIVHNPLEKDDAGDMTIEGTIQAVSDLLARMVKL
ncbi:MAG: flavodoxin family protein [Spirochaetes bacterium]|nr:flavodoxin family protein [Spirochaetota bacterium]